MQMESITIYFNAVRSSYRALLQKYNKNVLYLSRIKRMIEITYKIVHGMVLEYLIDFIS